jgi:hypothetical protein
LNPQTLSPMASTLTIKPPRRLIKFLINILHLLGMGLRSSFHALFTDHACDLIILWPLSPQSRSSLELGTRCITGLELYDESWVTLQYKN